MTRYLSYYIFYKKSLSMSKFMKDTFYQLKKAVENFYKVRVSLDKKGIYTYIKMFNSNFGRNKGDILLFHTVVRTLNHKNITIFITIIIYELWEEQKLFINYNKPMQEFTLKRLTLVLAEAFRLP